jgi:hypothetical protein
MIKGQKMKHDVCPQCKKALIKSNLIIKGRETWCKNCNRQFSKVNKNGSFSFWMPPLKVDKNGVESLPDGWKFSEVEDIANFKGVDPDAEITLFNYIFGEK